MGATQSVPGRCCLGLGLSPRVRGNRPACPLERPLLGSIPASAGQPIAQTPATIINRVYPRECGATTRCVSTSLTAIGLSPRVRGNPVFPPAQDQVHRSIPASAGQPGRQSCSDRPVRVYPRECGATSNSMNTDASDAGLSPRVRGNPTVTNQPVTANGSIPASAGQPSCW